MSIWLLLAAALGHAAGTAATVHYKAVTETEYAIELTLQPDGRAQFQFDTWEADDSSPPTKEMLSGIWSQQRSLITIQLASGLTAIYKTIPCLSYQEFAQQGCSPGLKLVSTNLPADYGLQRFGLWDASVLRVQP